MSTWVRRLAAALVLLLASVKISLAATSAGGYAVEHLDVAIQVQPNNTYNITETIAVNFREPRHGIYRQLPLSETVTRSDATRSWNRVQIKNITANVVYQLERANGELVIRLGSDEETLQGPMTYVLAYTYNPGADPLPDADEFYFNLVGLGWDVPIEAVSFTITLPADFDAERLGFSRGAAGSTAGTGISYQVDGRQISGTATTLQPGEGLTVRLTLPEGYFVGAGLALDPIELAAMALALGLLGIAGWLWWRHGRREPVVETVEFYPPAGYNSAEIATAYYGQARSDGVISLLLYLADHGYVRIIDTAAQGGYRLEKIKDYDGGNQSERRFMEGLFARGASVTANDLREVFYTTIDHIKTDLDRGELAQRWWSQPGRTYQKIALGLLVVDGVLAMSLSAWPYLPPGDALCAGVVIAAALAILAVLAPMFINDQTTTPAQALFYLLAACFLIACRRTFAPLPQTLFYYLLDTGYALSWTAILYVHRCLRQRTPAGRELLGQIIGFRRFLETAEKPRLEALVADNPHYFYNILPYTYALGVSTVWAQQFRSLAQTPPDWYVSPNPFDNHRFYRFVDRTMNSASRAMTARPTNNSGGNFSGGGFSGGGHGGGGGGSW